MIRLTLLLVAAIGLAMFLLGGGEPAPRATAPTIAPAPEAPAAEDGPDLFDRVGALIESAGTAETEAEYIPLGDEKRAIEIALAATRAPKEATPEAEDTPTQESGDTDPARTDLWVVTGSRVNLRAGPSTADSVVGRVREGQRATMLEETADGWYRIEVPGDGQSGYIFGQFLSPPDAG